MHSVHYFILEIITEMVHENQEKSCFLELYLMAYASHQANSETKMRFN
jgi:hypothetical protein